LDGVVVILSLLAFDFVGRQTGSQMTYCAVGVLLSAATPTKA